MNKTLIALLLTFLLAGSYMQAQPITAGQHTRVETVYGPIEGYQDGSIFTFKGIRYAKAERFMPPQAPDKFTELRQCKVYGPLAPQNESLRWNDRNSQTDYGFGTTVFPDAELKVFVTASAEVRAQRRYDELLQKGMPADYDDILKNVQERDYIDSHRDVSPLRQADDALLLDNSEMTIPEQKQWLLDRFHEVAG